LSKATTILSAVGLAGALSPLLVGSEMPASASATPPAYLQTVGATGGVGHASLYPSGVDVDPSGNVYVADTANDQVAAYNSSGAQLWRVGVRGPGQKNPGRFTQPRDISYAAAKVYVADLGNNRVQVLNAADGSVSAVWSFRFTSAIGITAGTDGAGHPLVLVTDDQANGIRAFSTSGALLWSLTTPVGNAAGQFNAPRDAATDAAGNIYVADYANDRIQKFDRNRSVLLAWGSRGTGNGQFNRPYGIALDAAGEVFVADSQNSRIQKFDGSGVFKAVIGTGQFGLRRVAVGSGPNPEVYGADLWSYQIQRYNSAGTVDGVYGGSVPATGAFNEPYGMEVDGTNLYVSDTDNQRVQAFDPSTGAFQFTWGTRGFGDGNPGFNWPRDLTINTATNTVWVADTKNNRLTEFDRAGNPTGRTMGKLGSGTNQLHWPYGIASSGAQLVVADTNNNRIELWDPSTASTLWTTSGFNFPKDVTVVGSVVYVTDSLNAKVVRLNAADGTVIDSFGTPQLHRPEGVAVAPNGNIWVSDPPRNAVLEFAANGTYLQTFGKAGSGPTQFNNPTHLEILVSGSVAKLLVMDTWNDRIQIFDVTGR
jgi:DNA-binding beta-propeller fold protein YncE